MAESADRPMSPSGPAWPEATSVKCKGKTRRIAPVPPMAGPKKTSNIHTNTTSGEPFTSDRTAAPTAAPIPR